MEYVGSYRLLSRLPNEGPNEVYEALDGRSGRKVRLRLLVSGASEWELLAFESQAREGGPSLLDLGVLSDGRPYAVYDEGRATAAVESAATSLFDVWARYFKKKPGKLRLGRAIALIVCALVASCALLYLFLWLRYGS